jgi:hypothetical protein
VINDRNEKRVEAAKRAQTARLGQSGAAGKRKRCKKGKSCGATCISGGKVCLVDLPWVSSNGLKKVANTVQSSKKNKPVETSAKLSKLETAAEFREKLLDTDGFYDPSIEKMHTEMQRIFGRSNGEYLPIYTSSDEKAKYEAIRKRVAAQLGNTTLAEAYTALIQFTGSYHKEIRDVQRGMEPEKHKDKKWKFKLWGQDIEKLLKVTVLPRPEVEKYRGFSVPPGHLQKMIQAAQGGVTLPASSTTSWSTSLDTARGFSEIKRKPENTEMVILRTINKTGVPIESVSSVEVEFEVLTSKNSKYKYLNYRPITRVNPFTKQEEIFHVFDVAEQAA